jgi:serine/threonine protein kinase
LYNTHACVDSEKRLISEVANLSSLEDHQNIVKFYSAAIDRSTFSAWIAFEKIACCIAKLPFELCRMGNSGAIPVSLGQLIKMEFKQRTLRMKILIDIAEQLLNALCYLHDVAGIVHRDIKADNVMVSNTNHNDQLRPNNCTFKIIDFGLSIRIEDLKNESVDERRVGTRKMMAPELKSEKLYDERVDIWSLCKMLLIFGLNDPRSSIDDENIPLKIQENVDALIFSHELGDFLMQGLNFNPKLRPNARQLLMHPVFSGKLELQRLEM